MSKQIWLAPILSDNRQRLIGRCADMLAAGEPHSFLYLTASRPLLDVVTTRLLDGERNRGVWGTLPVFLFRGFVRHLLATAVDNETGLPNAPRIPIDRDELPLKRSLISQLMSRLLAEGKLPALGPLAHREGCVNSIAALIGEIQRAAKSPAEFSSIVEARERDFHQSAVEAVETPATLSRQIDFDREIGLIYSAYQAALDRFRLSEDDADQLRALAVMRGEIDGSAVSVPWLPQVELLVLDGFFDFTPAQGEMLRFLIPSIPEVIVNLNRDDQNVEIFRPFASTIEQLNSIATFETVIEAQAEPVAGDLAPLRERLFNPSGTDVAENESRGGHGGPPLQVDQDQTSDRKLAAGATSDATEGASQITLLECSDRQTEIRAIAKRIKQLVLTSGYELTDVGLVVRELASYAEAIARAFEEESIPWSLQRRMQLSDVPAVRAALKLFELLNEQARDAGGSVKVSELANLIKSGYFGLPESELDRLRERFKSEDEHLLAVGGFRKGPDDLKVGQWNPDELENAIAYVGAELRVDRWLRRARQLTARASELEAENRLATETEDEPDSDEESIAVSDQQPVGQRRRFERAEPVDVPLPGSERRPKPASEVHPSLIAWSALVVERFAELLASAPPEGRPRELRDSVMRMLEQLQFAGEVHGSQYKSVSDAELPPLTLDLRGLEGLRRALAAATKSIEIGERITTETETPSTIRLATLLEEAMRSVRAQALTTAGGDPDGLKVLEATDIRGLRFRVLFVAGLVEGGFPLRASRDWIYPHEERERLKRYGLTLEDISPDTLLKEEHYFYQTACRATDLLYMSRPLVLEDGAETVASYYIEELRRAVAPAKVYKEIVRSDFDGRRLFESSRGSELAMLVVRQEERRQYPAQRGGNFSSEVIARLKARACELGYLTEAARRRIAIERERSGPRFGRFDGVIINKRLIAALGKRYDAGHDFSASELSLYGKCPFKFFAEKVLKLEPRGEAALDLTALDAGSILHEALRRFFERHGGERLSDLDRAALKRELGEVADEVFDEHQRVVPPLNLQVWKIDRETRKILLEQVLDYELEVEEKARDRDVRPAYFELAFGMKGGAVDPRSTDRRLELQRSSGDQTETARVRGQIDRVDLAQDGTAIAYDYKLSKGASLDDMIEGRALQLHIYLAALEQLFLPENTIAGGGYYTMKGGAARRNQGLYREVFTDYTGVSNRTASTLSDSEWKRIRDEMQARIWEFMDGMRAGQMLVRPSAPEATCPHCDYSAVCRYEKFRIRGKRDLRFED